MKKTAFVVLALLLSTGSHATTLIVEYVATQPASAPAKAIGPSIAPALAPGLYVQVVDGLINVKNTGGSQNFAAGQFGFTPAQVQAPVVLPTNPGIQFAPPPAFSVPGTVAGSPVSPKSNVVDCIVR